MFEKQILEFMLPISNVQYWKRLKFEISAIWQIEFYYLIFAFPFLSDSNGPITYALHSSHSQHSVSSSSWICGAVRRKHRHQVSEVTVQRPLYSMWFLHKCILFNQNFSSVVGVLYVRKYSVIKITLQL